MSHFVQSSVQSYLTRAGDRSKHPALSKSNRQTLLFVPGAQNLNAAPPGHRTDASLIVTGPPPQQHASVVITVDLLWKEGTQRYTNWYWRTEKTWQHDEVEELPWHSTLWKYTQGSFFLNGLCQGSSDILDSYPGSSDKHLGFHFQTKKY